LGQDESLIFLLNHHFQTSDSLEIVRERVAKALLRAETLKISNRQVHLKAFNREKMKQAIEAGVTSVRTGTAIFAERPSKQL
jgi:hypothetical protein